MATTTPAIFARSLAAVAAARPTTTHQFIQALADSLAAVPLAQLAQLEGEADTLLKGYDQESARPIRLGIRRAVSRAARQDVEAMTADAQTIPERARALYEIQCRNTTGYTPIGLRQQGAELTQIVTAEQADRAGDMLDEIMHQAHGGAWFDMQEEPLARAIAQGVESPAYRDWLGEQVAQLQESTDNRQAAPTRRR